MNKYYYELIITPSSYYELFLDLITSLIDDAIEENNGSIIVRSENDLNEIKNGINTFSSELEITFKTTINCKTILSKKENKNWIETYQKSIKPIEVGEFYIHPSWEKKKTNKKNILVEPTLAFGSGHHETTNTCLQMISKYVKKDMNILDVGCGSGILSIASTSLGANVDLCDTDIISVEESIKNFKANNLKYINIWEGSCNKTNKTYDIVIANIVADVLVMINKDLKKVTTNDGIIILSGIMNKYKNKILSKFSDCELIEEIQKNEWITLVVKVTK